MVSPTPFRRAEFRSSYGPNYHYQPNVGGFNAQSAFRLGLKSAAFGGAGGVALLFFASGIPRVRSDILQNVPVIGSLFIKPEVDPADNPF